MSSHFFLASIRRRIQPQPQPPVKVFFPFPPFLQLGSIPLGLLIIERSGHTSSMINVLINQAEHEFQSEHATDQHRFWTFFSKVSITQAEHGFSSAKRVYPRLDRAIGPVCESINQSITHSFSHRLTIRFFRKTVPIVPIVQLSKLSEHPLLITPPLTSASGFVFKFCPQGFTKNLDIDLQSHSSHQVCFISSMCVFQEFNISFDRVCAPMGTGQRSTRTTRTIATKSNA